MKRDIDFLFEMGALRRMQRNWERFYELKMSNDSEHTFRVLWLALIIAKKEGVKNEEKIMKLALVHDIVESRGGDVDYLSRQYVERNEELAIKDMLSETTLESEFVELWKESEKKESIEAKIVKDADNLDIDLELMEKKDSSRSLVETLIEVRTKGAISKLYTKTAKKMWEDIYKSDIHSWHRNGRNRLTQGDWKEEDKN